MGVAQGPTGFNPPAPRQPTDLEKELKAIPAHPWTFDVMRGELKTAGQDVDELVRNAAREYFTYLLMAGADKALLETDPYWKYMEE